MKLAIMKVPGHIPGGGYHYMLFIEEMNGKLGAHPEFFDLMGYTIVEVDDERGKRLLEEGRKALMHQLEVAQICEDPKYRVFKDKEGV